MTPVLAADPLDYSTWLLARSAGITAYVVLSAGVVLGLAMALRLVKPRRRAVVVVLHERLGLLALGLLGLHGLLILFDGWLKPGLLGVLVPFTMDYRPLWTGLGIIAFYLTAALSLSFYLRARIGARRWRSAHRFIPVAWGLATLHVLFAGTDAGSLGMQVPLALVVATVLAMLGFRWLAGAPRAPVRVPMRAPVAAPEPDPEPVPVHDTLWIGHAGGHDRR